MKKLTKSIISLLLAAVLLMSCCGIRFSGASGLVFLSGNISIGSAGGDTDSNSNVSGSPDSQDIWDDPDDFDIWDSPEDDGSNNVTGTPVPGRQDDPTQETEAPEIPDAPDAPAELPPMPDGVTPFSEMQYIHPSMENLHSLADKVCSLAKGTDADAIIDAYSEFREAYQWFRVAYFLSDIKYSGNLNDSYWEAEYNFCQNAYTEVSQMRNNIFTAMAASPCRKQLERQYGSLEDFDGENTWDDEMTRLMNRESELTNQYYAQCADETVSPDDVAQTLVDLIRIRNQLAKHSGYDTYEAFANDYYYYRDYTPAQVAAYLDDIRDEMVPLYRAIWDDAPDLDETNEAATLDYVRTAARGMGGKIWDAFQLMESAGLYDITYSDNKYDSSFEVYLDAYSEPFIFMNPDLDTYDHLTFAHEFGHFCNDYFSDGGQVSIDVCEIFSQGMEYLSLFQHPEQTDLARYKMADSLATYVEQACWAKFEHEMYLIPDSELNVQALYDLYNKTAAEYGFDALGFTEYDFIDINHFYTSPMYIISYIVSNDAAMQILLMEQNQSGSGLDCMVRNLSNTEPYFMAFLQSAGLKSPFDRDHLAEMRQMIQDYYPETVVGGSAAVQDDAAPDADDSDSNSNNIIGFSPAPSGSGAAVAA